MTVSERIEALKAWTGKSNVSILFDSTVNEFTNDGLFETVRGKWDVALIAITSDGYVFGGYYSTPALRQEERLNDPNMFLFSLESHGRCATPKQFPVKHKQMFNVYTYYFKSNAPGAFVYFGTVQGGVFLGNEQSRSYASRASAGFSGIENKVLGGTPDWTPFTCTRLLAVQLM